MSKDEKCPTNGNNNQPVLNKFVDWLLKQNVHTVLLCVNVSVTVYAVYYFFENVVPRHDAAVERMITRIEAQHDASLKAQAAHNAINIKYIMDSLRENERERARP